MLRRRQDLDFLRIACNSSHSPKMMNPHLELPKRFAAALRISTTDNQIAIKPLAPCKRRTDANSFLSIEVFESATAYSKPTRIQGDLASPAL